MAKWTGSKLEKEYDKAVYCYPAYYMQSTSWEMPGWMNHKLESRLLGEVSTTSDMQIIPLQAESEEELKSLLMSVKEDSEKAGFKLNVQKTKITASVPIRSQQIDGEIMETMTDFIFLGSQSTAVGDCSHEIKKKKKKLAPWKKSYDKLRLCIKMQRHHYADKDLSSQTYVFSNSHVWM